MVDKEEKTPSEETPSVEDQLASLTSKFTELDQKANKVEADWKNEQRISSRKEQDNQDLRASISDRASERDFQKAMLSVLAEGRGETEENTETSVKANMPTLLKQFDEREKMREAKLRQAEAQRIGEKYQRDVTDLSLTPKDRAYREIYQFVRDGSEAALEMADAIVVEEKAKRAKTVEPKESEEERQSAAEARAMEIVKEKFPDALVTETGGPSASSLSARDAKQAYIKGEITAEQAKERGANFD